MKNYRFTAALGFLMTLLVLFACRKSISNGQRQNLRPIGSDSLLTANSDNPAIPIVPFPQSPLMGCSNNPNYGDSIVYPQPTNGQDDIIHPVNNPGAGKYLSWPAGLLIDSLTGAIDLTTSEAGQKYAIGFVEKGTTDTCISSLIVGGASYMDSIYVLNEGSWLAFPYFDANPDMPSICGTLPNGSAGCSFDVTGSATNHKMVIDKSTGVIDLKRSLNGIFGAHPVNGQMAAITIYYQLNDASNLALQHLQVDIVYYDNQSAMNLGLVDKIRNKHAQELAGQLILPSANPRPPLIVIIRTL